MNGRYLHHLGLTEAEKIILPIFLAEDHFKLAQVYRARLPTFTADELALLQSAAAGSVFIPDGEFKNKIYLFMNLCDLIYAELKFCEVTAVEPRGDYEAIAERGIKKLVNLGIVLGHLAFTPEQKAVCSHLSGIIYQEVGIKVLDNQTIAAIVGFNAYFERTAAERSDPGIAAGAGAASIAPAIVYTGTVTSSALTAPEKQAIIEAWAQAFANKGIDSAKLIRFSQGFNSLITRISSLDLTSAPITAAAASSSSPVISMARWHSLVANLFTHLCRQGQEPTFDSDAAHIVCTTLDLLFNAPLAEFADTPFVEHLSSPTSASLLQIYAFLTTLNTIVQSWRAGNAPVSYLLMARLFEAMVLRARVLGINTAEALARVSAEFETLTGALPRFTDARTPKTLALWLSFYDPNISLIEFLKAKVPDTPWVSYITANVFFATLEIVMNTNGLNERAVYSDAVDTLVLSEALTPLSSVRALRTLMSVGATADTAAATSITPGVIAVVHEARVYTSVATGIGAGAGVGVRARDVIDAELVTEIPAARTAVPAAKEALAILALNLQWVRLLSTEATLRLYDTLIPMMQMPLVEASLGLAHHYHLHSLTDLNASNEGPRPLLTSHNNPLAPELYIYLVNLVNLLPSLLQDTRAPALIQKMAASIYVSTPSLDSNRRLALFAEALLSQLVFPMESIATRVIAPALRALYINMFKFEFLPAPDTIEVTGFSSDSPLIPSQEKHDTIANFIANKELISVFFAFLEQMLRSEAARTRLGVLEAYGLTARKDIQTQFLHYINNAYPELIHRRSISTFFHPEELRLKSSLSVIGANFSASAVDGKIQLHKKQSPKIGHSIFPPYSFIYRYAQILRGDYHRPRNAALYEALAGDFAGMFPDPRARVALAIAFLAYYEAPALLALSDSLPLPIVPVGAAATPPGVITAPRSTAIVVASSDAVGHKRREQAVMILSQLHKQDLKREQRHLTGPCSWYNLLYYGTPSLLTLLSLGVYAFEVYRGIVTPTNETTFEKVIDISAFVITFLLGLLCSLKVLFPWEQTPISKGRLAMIEDVVRAEAVARQPPHLCYIRGLNIGLWSLTLAQTAAFVVLRQLAIELMRQKPSPYDANDDDLPPAEAKVLKGENISEVVFYFGLFLFGGMSLMASYLTYQFFKIIYPESLSGCASIGNRQRGGRLLDRSDSIHGFTVAGVETAHEERESVDSELTADTFRLMLSADLRHSGNNTLG